MLSPELGVNFEHILANTKSVLNPWRKIDPESLQDADLAGPFCFCLAFGFSLLLVGQHSFLTFVFSCHLIASSPHLITSPHSLISPLLHLSIVPLGACQGGKVHGFGYIYGVSTIGCIGIYVLLMMMCDLPVDIYKTVSVLGYGLLPLVVLATVAPFISLRFTQFHFLKMNFLSLSPPTHASLFGLE